MSEPAPTQQGLPPALRPPASPPAAAGRTGALLHRFSGADRAVARIERAVAVLQATASWFVTSEIVPLLEPAGGAAVASEARRRLRQIPEREELIAFGEQLEEALCGKAADEVVLSVFVTTMIAMKFNAKIQNRESYVEGLIYTVWYEQEWERFTPQVIASGVMHVTKTCTFPPEAAEFLEILRERRRAMADARERVARLLDLRDNASDVLCAAAPRAPIAMDADDETIPF